MPIKLGLVIAKRENIALLNIKQPVVEPPQQQQQQQPEQKGITLRRVMNAPKTGCKSCGG